MLLICICLLTAEPEQVALLGSALCWLLAQVSEAHQAFVQRMCRGASCAEAGLEVIALH